MSLSVALSNALSGLNVNKQALSVLSNNIANANTVGYTRKVIDQSARVVDGAGAGASVDEIARKVDEYLSRSVQRQAGLYTRADTMSQYAQRIQTVLGKPGAGGNLASTVTDFFNVTQTLADSPESNSLKLNVVNAGTNLATRFNQLANDLEDLRYQADVEIGTSVRTVNNSLKQLAAINLSIADAYNAGKSSAELSDKRDAMLKSISSEIDISYYLGQDGQAFVSTNTGISLYDGSLYELSYTPQPSKQAFIQGASLLSMDVYRLDASGARIGSPTTLVSGGASENVVTGMQNGRIRGLVDMRDQKIPQILQQLDELASTIRDEVNAVHNSGIPYPGANSFTGTREVNPADYSQWSGSVRIALLDSTGRPVASPYEGENGMLPLTIDLSTLDTGQGTGKPSMQGIINEINSHFTMPQNKAALGDLSNIRLVSNSAVLSSSSPQFTFDFDLENISGGNANFFVTGVTVLDDMGADITSLSSSRPSFNLAATNTFQTTNQSSIVTVNTASAHGLQEGDRVYLSDPGAVNGITTLNNFFVVSNVTATSFTIDAGMEANATGNANVGGQTGMPKYVTATTGDVTRAQTGGTITANTSLNSTSQFYTVRANVAVENSDGTMSIGQVQYRVNNGAANLLNQRYSAEAVSGQAELNTPTANSPLLKAILVDAAGNELAKLNGAYVQSASGYLKIVATNSSQMVAVDSMNSRQLGFPDDSPAIPGTNRGFAHYFELNNFFGSNSPTSTGDALKGSAINMRLNAQLAARPSLLSLGTLTQTMPSADPTRPPYYTYERNPGDNSIIQRLAGLASSGIAFDAAGGLGSTTTNFNGYAGEILAYISYDATNMEAERSNQQLIKDGFEQQYSSVSGVNLDEELANTIIYQNAYTASAKIISVADQLFETLINSFAG